VNVCCCCLFCYQLSLETFGYTLVYVWSVVPTSQDFDCIAKMTHNQRNHSWANEVVKAWVYIML